MRVVGAAADRKCLVTASRPLGSTRSMIFSIVQPIIILIVINDKFNNYQEFGEAELVSLLLEASGSFNRDNF